LSNIEVPEQDSKQTFLDGLTRLFPGIRYLGLGIWFAWMFIAFESTLWLSDVEVDGSNLVTMVLITYGASAIVLLSAPFLHKQVELILSSRSKIIIAGSLGTLGALAIILSGPYYLDAIWLFYLGCVLTGIASALITLRLGRIVGKAAPRRALIYISLSQLVVVIIYFFVLGNTVYAPVIGGPSLSAILAFLFLPLIAALIISIPAFGSRQTGDTQDIKQDPDSSKLQKDISKLSPIFWKLMIAVFIFITVATAVKGFVLNQSSVEATILANHMDILLRSVFALGFFFFAVRFRHSIALGKLYLFIMVFIATVVAIYPLFSITGSPLRVIVSFTLDLFDFIIWCLLAFIVYQKKIDSTIVFGFGRGVFMLGNTIGLFLGVGVLPILAAAGMEVVGYAIMAVLILIAATLVFSERDFDRLFSSNIAEIELTLDDITLMVDVDGATAGNSNFANLDQQGLGLSDQNNQGGKNEQDQKDQHERPWIAACKRVSEDAHLSAREQDVFIQLALGRGSESIANRLFISINTARTHTHNVYTKLNVHSRQELISLVDAEWKKNDS
jgi:DNA-binding CsgD family transcriptional regulator/MFS family permease